MRQVTISEARRQLTELVNSHEPIEITRNGEVVARLFPPGETPVLEQLYRTESPYDSAEFAPAWVADEKRRTQRRQRGVDALLNAMNSTKRPYKPKKG